jgi:lysophospholipid acyltransferase
MLLSFKDCVSAWSRMGWYGHTLIALSLVFFQAGGRRRLRKGLKKEEKPVPSVRVSPPSPPEDETDPKDLRWVKHALDNPGYQDAGEGVHADGGMVDQWMDGAETPVFEKPRPKEF